MNNLESINLTYNYLSEVYGLTKLEYVRKKLIKSGELRGLNPKSLVKYNLLTEQNDKYKWKGLIPQYFHAYDYYNAVRGKKKTYENLLSVLKNPENCDTDEIMEALTIKGACALHGLENSEIITKYENEIIDLNDYNVHELTNKSEIKIHPVTEGSLITKLNDPSINDNIKLNDDPDCRAPRRWQLDDANQEKVIATCRKYAKGEKGVQFILAKVGEGPLAVEGK